MPSATGQIVREELWRSVAWAGLGLVGWAILITELSRVPATPLTAVGLPALTWAFLTLATIAVRLLTGRQLQVRSRAGLALVAAVAVAAGGFAAVYAVIGLDYPLLWVGLAYGTVTLLTLAWLRRAMVPAVESKPLA